MVDIKINGQTYSGLSVVEVEKADGSGNLSLRPTTEPYVEETYNAISSLTNAIMHGYTSIRRYLFYGASDLVSISLPNTITHINEYAFYSCSKLALTSLPSNISLVGDYAFYSCSKLALTSLPSGIASIGTYGFAYCSTLALTSLPSGIVGINNYAFQNCTGLINMEISCDLSGKNIFKQCTGLQKVWFRSTCTTVAAASTSAAPFVGCSTSLEIYCEATSKPDDYGNYFNRTGTSGGTTVTVVYGQTTRPW